MRKTIISLFVAVCAVLAPAGARTASGGAMSTGVAEEALGGEGELTGEDWAVYLTPLSELVAGLVRIGEAEAAALAPRGVEVHLINSNNGEELTLFIPDGKPLPEADAEALAQLLRCRRSGRVKAIHPGLVALIADVAREYPGHTIEVTSGYRGHRAERKTSPHRAARAMDFRVIGVKTTVVRDFLWSTHREVGIGWYPHSNYLHMDVRPGQRDTSWTQRQKDGENSYNPGWAYKARKNASR